MDNSIMIVLVIFVFALVVIGPYSACVCAQASMSRGPRVGWPRRGHRRNASWRVRTRAMRSFS